MVKEGTEGLDNNNHIITYLLATCHILTSPQCRGHFVGLVLHRPKNALPAPALSCAAQQSPVHNIPPISPVSLHNKESAALLPFTYYFHIDELILIVIYF